MSAHVECTWGDGPDVLVLVSRPHEGDRFPWLEHDPNSPSAGSFGLTAPEALALAARLVQAAVEATRLDAGYAEVTAMFSSLSRLRRGADYH